MPIFQIIKNSQRNLIIFLVSCALFFSLITYGIYSITKVKKKPLIDNVNNPIDEEKEEDTDEKEKNNNPENEKKVEDNKQENKKEAKTEEKENNNPNEIIYPAFILDNKKTVIGLQCLTEMIVLLVLIWRRNNVESSDNMTKKYIESHNLKEDRSALKFALWFCKQTQGLLLVILFGLNYFVMHAIIIFPLTLIFKFTSKNSYWYLWKNYWQNHFNNFGSCFIFLFIMLLCSILWLMEIYIISERSKDDAQNNKH